MSDNFFICGARMCPGVLYGYTRARNQFHNSLMALILHGGLCLLLCSFAIMEAARPGFFPVGPRSLSLFTRLNKSRPAASTTCRNPLWLVRMTTPELLNLRDDDDNSNDMSSAF
jgi:hypothetical protein